MPDPGKILISERVLMLYLKGFFFSCGNSERLDGIGFLVIDFYVRERSTVVREEM